MTRVDWENVKARYANHGPTPECRAVKSYLLAAIARIAELEEQVREQRKEQR